MALIKWNELLSVNIAEIDQQHQQIIASINELNDAMKSGKGNDVVGAIVNNLITYTVTHFKTEEDLFAKHGYPDTQKHKKEHAAFVNKVSGFRDGFEKRKSFLTLEVMSFLSEWLSHHILGTDKMYVQFLNRKGVK